MCCFAFFVFLGWTLSENKTTLTSASASRCATTINTTIIIIIIITPTNTITTVSTQNTRQARPPYRYPIPEAARVLRQAKFPTHPRQQRPHATKVNTVGNLMG